MTKYKMLTYEPTIFVEIYLPKRTVYQPVLFDILSKGFDIEQVKKHFRSKDKRESILSLISGNPAWANFDNIYVDKIQEFLYGYSLYEVDGVYKGPDSSNPIVEERTQILRLIFRIDVDQIIKQAKSNLDDHTARVLICDHLKLSHQGKSSEAYSKEERPIIEEVEEWREQIGFFTFGYIMHELCSGIESLFEKHLIPKTEDEIWVTSFADIQLDRVYWPVKGNRREHPS